MNSSVEEKKEEKDFYDASSINFDVISKLIICGDAFHSVTPQLKQKKKELFARNGREFFFSPSNFRINYILKFILCSYFHTLKYSILNKERSLYLGIDLIPGVVFLLYSSVSKTLFAFSKSHSSRFGSEIISLMFLKTPVAII